MAITPDRWVSDVEPYGPVAVPIQVGLLAVAAETSRVASLTDQLQNELSPLVRQGGLADGAMQSLDEITQSLQGLSAYVEAVAERCAADWICDLSQACAKLRLYTQMLRLMPNAGAVDASQAAVPSGDLEVW